MSYSLPPQRALGQTEFIALIAMLFATIAFSIDAMLPALPEIAAELSPDAPNKAQLILTSFVFGMGLGTLFAGPLSDSYGRKTVIVAGAVLYCAGALLAYAAPTLETMLAARVLQGLGAAGPRVVSLALVRDLHSGARMARIVSFAMMIFTLVPAVAPLLGQFIIAGFGWRSIFLAFLLFSGITVLWLTIRQPETLARAERRPFRAAPLWAALREVLGVRSIRLSVLAQTLGFAALFGTLSSTQQLFDQTYGRAESFPLYFALIALIAGTSSLLNASLVMRLGMRRLVLVSFATQALVSGAFVIAFALALWPAPDVFPVEFLAYLIWTIGVFFMVGMTIGNLNALALEPVGHIAGMAASVVGALSTVFSVLLAAPVGLAFNGTPLPLMIGVAVFTGLAYLVARRL
ncbi:MAG: multidrug effflux MFS transporter [Pseudotabrizicola sp.]|uniref:multidrug effflux MFS transporter n=1 Tax=Pseudotabrizicola sp. TaxID=2939647 RepID=UPI002727BEBB|nr:multidrug effflux MFS transporter [Pseudotabrizicola sp.]MDO8882155.1 multidrug effflux MFS transporter [Pseudotabrizicola sp.]MDP2082670.1 multidrug effflux MFS transporter [Pseudotabrizicola sp.]MDZ7573566.1 multidrug effflux MFS transporter [Pseudotabrizicola sp.]